MAAMPRGTAWGQLVCCSKKTPPIRLMKDKISIGRTSDCDVSFISNKFISAYHCTLSRDKSGSTWLTDNSTNGTVVNGRKVKKNKRIKLNHEDQIQLVKRKELPNEDVVFIYQDLKQTEEEYNLLDNTEEYTADGTRTPELSDEACSFDEIKKSTEKRKQDFEETEVACTQQQTTGKDTIGETLACGICQDIFHDCLSLQPCMHSFCSACYSEWMSRSSECPTCRLPVERMSRNHIINNLVEAYLKVHPEKERPADEIAEMDARNKITEEMIRPSKKRRLSDVIDVDEDDVSDSIDSDVSSSDTLESDDDESDTIDPSEFTTPPTSFGSLFGFTPSDASVRATAVRSPGPVCRWCPGSRENVATSSQSSSASTESAGTEIRPGVPQPVCSNPAWYHLMCLCCRKPMPKLENLPRLPGGATYAKSQKCGICDNFYCNLLWKCDKPGCRGCLAEFKDLKFDNSCLDSILLNNKYESQILKNYLSSRNMTINDLVARCLEKLDTDSYITADCVTQPELNSNFILCYRCGLNNLKELALQFRRDIPRADLPAAVTSRPDCFWGRNCRTQTNPNNRHHARFERDNWTRNFP